MLDDTTECYKFYWLDSILDLLSKGINPIYFDDIINGMLISAWYSVGEYHLNLGLKDANGNILNSLERAVNKLINKAEIKNDVSADEILSVIQLNEKLIHDEKMQLAKMVPYRLLSSFFEEVRGDDKIWDQRKRLITYIDMINHKNRLPYTISDGVGLKKQVIVDEIWEKMLLNNFVQIKGWIQIKKVKYLQDRNPGVPGIIYKLEPENENARKLKYVRELWGSIMQTKSVYDIYSGKRIDYKKYDVDHFVPWSYIANDELWNLCPMDSSLNSSKNNKLPNWDTYFLPFANIQYLLYDLVLEKNIYREKFCKCQRDNLIAIWANEELYIHGLSKEKFMVVLENHLRPIYDSARIQGYSIWSH